MGIGRNVARLIQTDIMARMNSLPNVRITPGHWVYVVTKEEIAFLKATDVTLEVRDILYFYDDRHIFFINWKLNQMLCLVSDHVTPEYIDNLDIPFAAMDECESYMDKICKFEATKLKAGDFIVGLDDNDDTVVYEVK